MSAVSHSHFLSEPDHSHHDHTHGTIDPGLLTTDRGIWAVKWSLIGLGATPIFQVVIVFFSGSVALLADTIHNIADAATVIPLWIAFTLARRQPSRRFTYGYGRVEDVAGVMIVLTISAQLWQAMSRVTDCCIPSPLNICGRSRWHP